MTSALAKSYPRLWSLEGGRAMVVTDLHGDWPAYQRYRDRFVDLHARGQADWLILTGDLIHREDNHPDRSIDIVLDVLALQTSYGEAIIYLCGNHEMPHLYGISLAKGDRLFTPSFEVALNQSRRRADIIALFDALPFFLRTRAGVSLTHAGASPPLVETNKVVELFHWSHQQILKWAEDVIAQEGVESLRRAYAKFTGEDYETLAKFYLAVTGPADPRYNDLLRGFLVSTHPHFDKLLWPALFTRCEREYGRADYDIFLAAMLQELSTNFYPQQLLVAGHITIQGGHQISAKQHLRLASAYHATPYTAGQYLLFDTARPVSHIEELLNGLGTVYK